MKIFLYHIFSGLFRAAMAIASLFHEKARKAYRGRKEIFTRLQAAFPPDSKTIWMHCASLGEFEQGRPLLEKLKTTYPGYTFLLTFFSPSGYEIQKQYKGADHVFYLPFDSARNAKKFLGITQPALVIFVKYEYWFHYLDAIKKRKIPLLMVSAVFRKSHPFFKWYGGLHRRMLRCFTHLFLQNEASKELLDRIGVRHTTVSGDTRFDRVSEIARKATPLPLVESFLGRASTIVAGSTWPADEKLIQEAFTNTNHLSLKLVMAPHEIDAGHIAALQALFPGALLYSRLMDTGNIDPDARVLIIDNIGLLSRLYRYATITYVGGGFRTGGLHNVLEAAVYGKPVVIGPHYENFIEATGLVKEGAAKTISRPEELAALLEDYLQNKTGKYEETCNKARDFVAARAGATERVLRYIQENRLLTS